MRRFIVLAVTTWLVVSGAIEAVRCSAASTRRRQQTVAVQVRVDSQDAGYEAVKALDGNPATMWHTQFRGAAPAAPHEITLDLGGDYPIEGFVYTPRPGRSNGTIGRYAFYVSPRADQWGEPAVEGSFAPDGSGDRVALAKPVTGRYLRLTAFSEVHGLPYTSIAELEILSGDRHFVAEGTAQAAAVADDGTIEGILDLAVRTLEFVECSSPQPQLADALAKLKRRAENETAISPAEDETLYQELKQLRRKIILAHPALDFERLLINKRPPPGFCHQSDQYLGRHSFVGDGPVVLDNWKDEPQATVLLEGKLPPGSVLHPDLSFDGRRILFSYCDHSQPRADWRRFWIYEMNVDGTGLRQITGTAADPLAGRDGRETVLIEDFDPCYLPDGGIAFISTRNQGGVRCHHGERYCPTYTLYRCEADGSHIRPMVYGEANEWDPSVMHDGRIIWTRWDYINRHDTVYQSLWTIRPDGTATAVFYGNYSRNPCSIAEARAIPGSHKIVATAMAHHSYTAGSIVLVDSHKGQDGMAPITRVTPEVEFPETEGWPTSSYATPWPLSEDLFLVAYSDRPLAHQGGVQEKEAYSIWLIDTLGGRELIYRDEQMSCFAPMPLTPRAEPPALPSVLSEPTPAEGEADERAEGDFYVQNVYQSTEKLAPGSVKRLRVVEIYPQTTIRVPDRSQVLFETAKRVIGTAPVADDGSVAFRAPAGVPLLFQLLDENDMSVMSMRTFVYAHPGEQIGCVGCHEPRNSSPVRLAIPSDVKFAELRPSAGPKYAGGLSFARTVQPVFDRRCIGCHGLEKTEGEINLLGTVDTSSLKLGHVRASAAYNSLIAKPGLVSVALRNQEAAYSTPMDYFSHAGRLGALLLRGDKNHEPLPPDELRRVVQWMDLNGQFYGDYSWNKLQWQPPKAEAERALREHVARTFGEPLSGQPLAALVNVCQVDESRVLKAPLAVEAGGWGQLTPGWKNTDEPGYRRMRELVEACLPTLPSKDVCGTCNRTPCECRSCWVREARAEYRKQQQP